MPTSVHAQKIQPYQPEFIVAAMIESFEKKPANGKMPTSASDAIRNIHFVRGMSAPIPRMLRMSCSPASAWMITPAPGRAAP